MLDQNENQVTRYPIKGIDPNRFKKSANEITIYYVIGSAPVPKGQNIKDNVWLPWITVFNPGRYDTSELLFKTLEEAEDYQSTKTVFYDKQGVHNYRQDVRDCKLDPNIPCWLMPPIFTISVSELKDLSSGFSYFQISKIKSCQLEFQIKDMDGWNFRIGRTLQYPVDSKNEEISALFECQKFMASNFGLYKKALDNNLPKDLSQHILHKITQSFFKKDPNQECVKFFKNNFIPVKQEKKDDSFFSIPKWFK